jgi:sec-independent protein translocase protein TatA
MGRTMVIQLRRTPRDTQGAAMGLGIPELIVILLIILLIFGASRLPEIGRGIGKGIKNFKDATREGVRESVREGVRKED